MFEFMRQCNFFQYIYEVEGNKKFSDPKDKEYEKLEKTLPPEVGREQAPIEQDRSDSSLLNGSNLIFVVGDHEAGKSVVSTFLMTELAVGETTMIKDGSAQFKSDRRTAESKSCIPSYHGY